MKKFFGIAIVIILAANFLYSQNATITEIKQKFRTYGFSDPNPTPKMNNIYPYFRFDGFTDKPVDKEWKIIKMENPYIELYITPEIGGKIWGAFEKSTKYPFIYFNKTVKFRDIAMRGPWTSGGIEFNFGDIGHTPAASTPVDYLTRENSDGSVSCFVSCIDLPSRTTWMVEIKLEKDKAYFETKAHWYNSTEYNTSMYTWHNGAIDSGDDLELYYPGSNYIDHDGNLHNWHIAENGKDISKYAENNFGSYKSYHVLGSYTDYFGAYWRKQNFGFGHTSIYEDKPGKKIWIWGLSREGEIWTDLLTDKDLGNKQYVEVQTGMLYNQAVGNKTPFKHSFFEPGALLKFNEMWFPYLNTGGLEAANEYGALNAFSRGEYLIFSFCPLQNSEENLKVTVNGSDVYGKELNLKPLATFTDSVKIGKDEKYEILIGNKLKFKSGGIEEKLLSRPKTPFAKFDWNSIYGKYLNAVELTRSREYNKALPCALEIIDSDPNFLPALVLVSELFYRRAEFSKAADYVKRALQIDTYDFDANYWFGIISKKLGNNYDAKDALGIAARSMKYRSVSYQNIAEIYFIEGSMDKAVEFANHSIDYNSNNVESLKLLSIIYRIQQRATKFDETIKKIEAINPLEHFIRAEKYLFDKTEFFRNKLNGLIRCELPHEVYLELALYYYKIKKYDDAVDVLSQSPVNPIVNLWLAFLNEKNGNQILRDSYLKKALDASTDFALPYRNETFDVMNWAGTKNSSWKINYYKALFLWHKGRIEEAAELFNSCGDEPLNSSFYITRASFRREQSGDALNDYKRAAALDKNNWRAHHYQINYLNSIPDHKEALSTASIARSLLKESYILHFDYAKTLMLSGQYQKCLKELEKINLLPNEGAREGHDVYRSSYLMLAIEGIAKSKYKDALKFIEKAKEWPENLGAGKPYDFDLRIEYYLESICHNKMNDKDKEKNCYAKIDELETKYSNSYNANIYISALAKKIRGDAQTALELLKKWDEKSKNIFSDWAVNQFIAKSFIPIETKSWFVFENDFNSKLVYEIAKQIK